MRFSRTTFSKLKRSSSKAECPKFDQIKETVLLSGTSDASTRAHTPVSNFCICHFSSATIIEEAVSAEGKMCAASPRNLDEGGFHSQPPLYPPHVSATSGIEPEVRRVQRFVAASRPMKARHWVRDEGGHVTERFGQSSKRDDVVRAFQ